MNHRSTPTTREKDSLPSSPSQQNWSPKTAAVVPKKHRDSLYDRNTMLLGVAMLWIYLVILSNGNKESSNRLSLWKAKIAQGWTSSKPNNDDDESSSSNHDQLRSSWRQSTSSMQGKHIELPKPPPPVSDIASLGSMDSTTSSTGSTNALSLLDSHHGVPLNYHAKNGTLVTLLHIGKTGGSALRDLIDYAHGYCQTNYLYDKSKNDTPTRSKYTTAEGSLFHNAHLFAPTALQKHMCALARVTNAKGVDDENEKQDNLIHLDRNLGKTLKENHFLVPIRNPIDRLVSWFYYERFFQTEKKTRFSQNLQTLLDPEKCNLSTMDELVVRASANEEQPHDCSKIARECLVGDIPCYGHNFFNYEYYLEDVLVRILKAVAAAKEQKDDDKQQSTLTPPRVDVIRTEHSWDDLNQTLSAWTGVPMTPDMEFFYLTRKPYDVDTSSPTNNQKLSPSASQQLCQMICPELVAYSKVIKYATNLSPSSKKESFRELDETCGFSVQTKCGNSFRYRKIRSTKQNALCEPSQNAENGSGSSYLKEHSDLPPC